MSKSIALPEPRVKRSPATQIRVVANFRYASSSSANYSMARNTLSSFFGKVRKPSEQLQMIEHNVDAGVVGSCSKDNISKVVLDNIKCLTTSWYPCIAAMLRGVSPCMLHVKWLHPTSASLLAISMQTDLFGDRIFTCSRVSPSGLTTCTAAPLPMSKETISTLFMPGARNAVNKILFGSSTP